MTSLFLQAMSDQEVNVVTYTCGSRVIKMSPYLVVISTMNPSTRPPAPTRGT